VHAYLGGEGGGTVRLQEIYVMFTVGTAGMQQKGPGGCKHTGEGKVNLQHVLQVNASNTVLANMHSEHVSNSSHWKSQQSSRRA